MKSTGFYLSKALFSRWVFGFCCIAVIPGLIIQEPRFAIGGILVVLVIAICISFMGSFRSYFDESIKANEKEEQRKKLEAMLQNLPSAYQQRFRTLHAVAATLKSSYQLASNENKDLVKRLAIQVNDLLIGFAKITIALYRFESRLSKDSVDELCMRIHDLEKEIAEATGELLEGKLRQKAIIEKRLEYLHSGSEQYEILKTQVETVEELVKLSADQALSVQQPEEISGLLDSIMAEIQTGEETISVLDSFQGADFDRKIIEETRKRKNG